MTTRRSSRTYVTLLSPLSLLFLGCSSAEESEPVWLSMEINWAVDSIEVSLAALPMNADFECNGEDASETHVNEKLGTKVEEFVLEQASQLSIRCVDSVFGTVEVSWPEVARDAAGAVVVDDDSVRALMDCETLDVAPQGTPGNTLGEDPVAYVAGRFLLCSRDLLTISDSPGGGRFSVGPIRVVL